jgi:hypothetical protein
VTSSSRYLLLRTHQLSLDAFLVALKFMHVEDVDIDEVQCILANLIYMVRESSSLLKQLPWPLEPYLLAFFFSWFFETGSCCVSQTSLELAM